MRLIRIAFGPEPTPAERPTSGLVGAVCDRCGESFHALQAYVTICSPRNQDMKLYHFACVKIDWAR